jgi:Gas vesicle synthesis protein GvpL/GvpF
MIESESLERLRRGIENLAASEIDDLLSEARIEARAKVRSILVEAIAEQLLQRAEAGLEGDSNAEDSPLTGSSPRLETAPQGKRTATPSAATQATDGDLNARSEPAHASEAAASQATQAAGTHELGWYVYGVVAEDCQLGQMPGIDGAHHVGVIAGEGVGAVTSKVRLSEFGEESLHEHLNDLAWLEENARRHEQILDRVRGQTTLVPMRLCTIYRTETSVREMLAREHEFLADALRRLEGRTEWGVKLFVSASGLEPGREQDSAALNDVTERLTEAGPGESYLLKKRLEGLRQADSESVLEEFCSSAHERLSALSIEAKLNPVQPRELTNRDGQMILNGVYLVDDTANEEFGAQVAGLADEYRPYGLEVELTGPWPPYNFVNDSTEVGR